MKHVLILPVVIVLLMACKTSKSVHEAESSQTNDTNQDMISGVVSHKYKAGGCTAVIIAPNGGDTLVLIPTAPLGKFDKDGMKVKFSYHPLRRPTPEGCIVGIPATIVGIQKDK